MACKDWNGIFRNGISDLQYSTQSGEYSVVWPG